MTTDKKRRIEYIKENTSFASDRDIVFSVMRENGNWEWFSDDQLADIINHLTRKWRRTAAMNLRNRERASG